MVPIEASRTFAERSYGTTSADQGRLALRFRLALDQLVEARTYADDVGQDAWDFAVEVAGLNLTLSDLRWLACKGYVEHAREVTRRGEERRSFQATGTLTFSERSCLVITNAGRAFWRATAGGAVATALRPCWDGRQHELRVGVLWKWIEPLLVHPCDSSAYSPLQVT